jgi:hypothetical protein
MERSRTSINATHLACFIPHFFQCYLSAGEDITMDTPLYDFATEGGQIRTPPLRMASRTAI